jgi:hypothetical protein
VYKLIDFSMFGILHKYQHFHLQKKPRTYEQSLSIFLSLKLLETTNLPGILAHAYSPSYSESEDWKDCGSRPAPAKK